MSEHGEGRVQRLQVQDIVVEVLRLVEPDVTISMTEFLGSLPHDVLEMMLEANGGSLIKILSPCWVEVEDNVFKETAYATWSRQFDIPDFMKKEKWSKLFGSARDQGEHSVCWAFVTAELIEALMRIHKVEGMETKFSPQDLIDFAHPERRKVKKENNHYCYGLTVRLGLLYVKENGLQREHDRPFVGCPERVRKRNNARRANIGSVRKVKQIERIFEALKHRPINATLPIFDPEYRKIGDKIYRGPREAGSRLVGLHAITLVSTGVEAGEQYVLARSSHGPDFGCLGGYLKVSLDAMILHLPRAGESVARLDMKFSKPRALIWGFCYPKLPPGGDKGKKERK